MNAKLLLILLLISCLLFVGPACNRASYGADDKSKIHVGIVFDIGGKDDRSFNAAAWTGVKCAETGMLPDGKTSCGKPAMDIVLRDVEPGNPTSIEPAMRAFAERNYDLIIGVGFAQAPIMEVVAKDYPNLHFAIIDGVSELPNVASLVFKEHEGSYLVGIIAAKTTKTNVLGFVGGMDIPLIHRFEKGYEEGAKAVNPNIQIVQNYVGVTDAAWNNPGKGKELSLAQISKGADVIFTAAGNSTRSFSFSDGISTVVMPPRKAASSFSFSPPIGSTLPRSVTSPVIATSRRTANPSLRRRSVSAPLK